jgi:iron(III) transport system substrate-binding protein
MRSLALTVLICLCGAVNAQKKVVVYVSMDQDHSEKILEVFEQRTGIDALPQFDTEDNKTVGLTNRIIAERESPSCDVFWNNEAGQTVRLKNLGLLAPYESPNARGIPPGFRDSEHFWTGFAARARVLIYNTEMVTRDQLPIRLEDLADPRFKGQCAMSKPLTGTGMTHAGALYARWGAEKTEAFYRALDANDVRWERGNAQVMREVSKGTRPFGMTDTDDARVASVRGEKTDIVYLDQGEGEMGSLVIPNTVMIIKDGPNPEEARRLVDFLLSTDCERLLAEGRSAQIPLHPGVPAPPHVTPLEQLRPMEVDYADVGRMLEQHARDLEALFSTDGSSSGFSLLWAAAILVIVLIVAVKLTRGPRSVS